MKWARMIGVQLFAVVSLLVLTSESDVYSPLQLLAIKIVAGAVLALSAYYAYKWHKQGKMPKWWYDTIREE